MAIQKKYKITIGIILSLALLLLVGSIIISRIISQKVVQILEDQNIENLHISIEKTKFSLFDRSLVFTDVHLSPDDAAMVKLQKNKLDKKSLHKVSISRLKFKGIHLGVLCICLQMVAEINEVQNPGTVPNFLELFQIGRNGPLFLWKIGEKALLVGLDTT